MSPELVIFYRCLLAALVLFFFIRYKKISFKTQEKSHVRYILLGGVLMAIHWVSYFYSLTLSNIAIAMLTLHTFPAMTSILEPMVLKTRFKYYHIFLAVLVLKCTSCWASEYHHFSGVPSDTLKSFWLIVQNIIAFLIQLKRNSLIKSFQICFTPHTKNKKKVASD